MNIPVDLTISSAAIITVMLAVIGWVQTRWMALSKRLDAQDERIGSHSNRIVSVEEAVRGLPTREDLHRMETGLVTMAGELKVVSTMIAGQKDILHRVENVVNRHEDHLLKN